MPDWNRIQREVGKSLVTGAIGGYIAIMLNDGYSLADFFAVILFFFVAVVTIGVYEYKFPPRDDDSNTEDSHEPPRIAS